MPITQHSCRARLKRKTAHLHFDVALDAAAGLAAGQHVHQCGLAGARLDDQRRQHVWLEGAADILRLEQAIACGIISSRVCGNSQNIESSGSADSTCM